MSLIVPDIFSNEELRHVLRRYFRNPSLFIPIGQWDVSRVTDMSLLFHNNPTFNEHIQSWDVSNVFSMKKMFCKAIKFNKPLNQWNIRNVTDMCEMFQGAAAFNPSNIQGWNIRPDAYTTQMFTVVCPSEQTPEQEPVSESEPVLVSVSSAPTVASQPQPNQKQIQKQEPTKIMATGTPTDKHHCQVTVSATEQTTVVPCSVITLPEQTQTQASNVSYVLYVPSSNGYYWAYPMTY